MTAQNKATKSNFIKAKIDFTPQNSECRLCREVDETVIHKSACSKHKMSTRMGRKGDPVGIVRHWYLSILPNGICTKKNLYLIIRRIKSSETLRYKEIT